MEVIIYVVKVSNVINNKEIDVIINGIVEDLDLVVNVNLIVLINSNIIGKENVCD